MMDCIKIFVISLLLFVATATSHQVSAYTEEENFAFIKRIVGMLNNNNECQLPTFEEVDEMERSFTELEEELGSVLDSKLNSDEKLIRSTLLDQWTIFRERLTTAVVIRSVIKRTFLGKIEKYQVAKFGSSVCIGLRDVSNQVTDHIFVKNPTIRYLKHLDSGEVIERPTEEDQIIHTQIEPSSLSDNKANSDNVDPLSDIPVPPAAEAQEGVSNELEAESTTLTSTTTKQAETENLTEASVVEEPTEAEFETTTSVELASTYNTSEVLEESTTFSSYNTVPQVDTTTKTPEITTFKPKPVLFDKNGADLVNSAADDEDLNRLNKLPPKNWSFDRIYGDFKWPDEGQKGANIEGCVKQKWSDFLLNPDVPVTVRWFQDEFLIEEEPEEEPVLPPKTTRKPLSSAELKKKKKEFFTTMVREDRMMAEDDAFDGKVDESVTAKPRKVPKALTNPAFANFYTNAPPTVAPNQFQNQNQGYYVWVGGPMATEPAKPVIHPKPKKKTKETGVFVVVVEEKAKTKPIKKKKQNWAKVIDTGVCKLTINRDINAYDIRKSNFVKKAKLLLGYDEEEENSKKFMMMGTY